MIVFLYVMQKYEFFLFKIIIVSLKLRNIQYFSDSE